MPSYPSDIWDDDYKAWAHLSDQGYTQYKGMISPPNPGFIPDAKTQEAVNYLCGEWDYGFSQFPIKQSILPNLPKEPEQDELDKWVAAYDKLMTQIWSSLKFSIVTLLILCAAITIIWMVYDPLIQ